MIWELLMNIRFIEPNPKIPPACADLWGTGQPTPNTGTLNKNLCKVISFKTTTRDALKYPQFKVHDKK